MLPMLNDWHTKYRPFGTVTTQSADHHIGDYMK